jgi:hypothetical protein
MFPTINRDDRSKARKRDKPIADMFVAALD